MTDAEKSTQERAKEFFTKMREYEAAKEIERAAEEKNDRKLFSKKR